MCIRDRVSTQSTGHKQLAMLSWVLVMVLMTAAWGEPNCHLVGPFYRSSPTNYQNCTLGCLQDGTCYGVTWKHVDATGGAATPNCTGSHGQGCCYLQSASQVQSVAAASSYDCWIRPGSAEVKLGPNRSTFSHLWEHGINSPHSAMTLRADWRSHMSRLKIGMNYRYTRIHAPFSRDFSISQGPNATSYYNAFSVYDYLLGIGVKPWIELGYTPCWMSGPAAVAMDSYWPTVEYGLCVGSPVKLELWTDMIRDYVAAMVNRYGLAEVESWVWVLFNEPGGVNAYSQEWQSGGFSYYDLFFNTSQTLKSFSRSIKVGGLSDSPSQAAELVSRIAEQPSARANLLDLFTYHAYCNGQSATQCAQAQVATVHTIRKALGPEIPVFLEETGSSAGPYDAFHDSTGEAAFVVPYIKGLQGAGLAGAFWWVSSDLYTEHGSLPNYTWIPRESYSGGMPRAEFTGRWGFISPSGIAKPIFRGFELLSLSGDQQVDTSNDGGCGDLVPVSYTHLTLPTKRIV
eukprot:TRINITY_DN24543_c0_g1_i3.p1 TRINITY_DN24543_c0_g1~~TRINITY_DN24543_c0_g1_i3.p1  ORF type:complete len:514 (-),score=111.05 TRINITY_DN24543_c0_g1_i3:133-1674(-)